MAARRPYRLWLGLILMVLAVVGTLVLRVPLGAPEAHALAWLDRFVAAAGISLDAFGRAFAAAYDAGRPALSLALATAVSRWVPSNEALIAVRLPDALAALGLAVLVYRMFRRGRGCSEAGFAAGLWVVVFAVACIGWVASPGLILDQGAATLLFAACRAHGAGRSRWTVWLGLLIGSGALVANGAGIYAVAVIGGLWLHDGLSRGDWRLLGSYRLTALGGLLVAGLTLTPALGVPRLMPFDMLYHQYPGTLGYDGVPPLLLWCLASWAVLVIPAAWATAARARGAPGRHALVVLLGCVILSMAGTTSPIRLVCLAPFAALWLIAPICADADDVARPPRWMTGLYGLIFAGQAILLAAWCATADADVARTPLVWAIAAAVVVLVLATAVAAWRGRSSAPGSDALPFAVVILALTIALIGVLDQPRRFMPQRVFDRSLASDIQAFKAHPIAVLAPVSAALWRAELGRPVFSPRNLSALCRWAAPSENDSDNESERERHPFPIAMVRAATTNRILARFPSARLALQSPGTPTSSVMVIRLRQASEPVCERPDS